MEAALKMGYRFHPTEEEIVSYFLGEKLCGRDDNVSSINEVDINNFEPWDLRDRAANPSNDPVWYFFTKPDYMDAGRMRVNRKTKAGFWKVTGKDCLVKDKRGRVIGFKKTLVFHHGRTPDGVRTHWVIQEFHHKEANKWGQRHFVLCRLKMKSDDGDEPSPPQLASNSGNYLNVNIVPQENNELRLELLPRSHFNDDVLSALHFLIGRAQGPSRSNDSMWASGEYQQLYITDQEVDSMWASGEYQQLHEGNQLEAALMGYRFRPTEEEIVNYFLGEKLCGRDDNVRSINEVDINNFEPWVLRDRAALQSSPVWHFFTKPDYIDAGRMRVNRKTEAGFWKVTGKDRLVKDKHGRVIGFKKTLVFYRGRTPDGVKTHWVIQEFHHKEANKWGQRHFVLCRLKMKSDDGDEPSPPQLASNSGNCFNVSIISQEHQILMDVSEHPAAQGPSYSNGCNYQTNTGRSHMINSSYSTEHEDQEFVNSLLADREGEYSFEETVNTRQVDA